MIDFVGIPTPLQRMIVLQQEAFEGVKANFGLGIRHSEVKVGEYLAPSHEVLDSLLRLSDARISELLKDPRFENNFDYAVRAVSSAYLLYILIHPLRDGNGQVAVNLVSSLLFEGGHRKIFFRAFRDGRRMKATALGLISTREAPTVDLKETPTRDLSCPEAERERREWRSTMRKQRYSAELIRAITGPEVWPLVADYVGGVKVPEIASLPLETEEAAFASSFLKRLNEISVYARTFLTDEPTGSKRFNFSESQRAVELGEKMGRF